MEKVAVKLTALTYFFTCVDGLQENRTCVVKWDFESHLSSSRLCQNGGFQVESHSNLTLQQDYDQHVSPCDDTIVCLSESPLYLVLPLCAI